MQQCGSTEQALHDLMTCSFDVAECSSLGEAHLRQVNGPVPHGEPALASPRTIHKRLNKGPNVGELEKQSSRENKEFGNQGSDRTYDLANDDRDGVWACTIDDVWLAVRKSRVQ